MAVKPGVRSTEFWFGLLVCAALFALLWWDKYPPPGTAGEEGIDYVVMIWAFYAGAQKIMKWRANNHSPTAQP